MAFQRHGEGQVRCLIDTSKVLAVVQGVLQRESTIAAAKGTMVSESVLIFIFENGVQTPPVPGTLEQVEMWFGLGN